MKNHESLCEKNTFLKRENLALNPSQVWNKKYVSQLPIWNNQFQSVSVKDWSASTFANRLLPVLSVFVKLKIKVSIGIKKEKEGLSWF